MIRLAVDDEEPVAVTMEQVGTEYHIRADAHGHDLRVHACGPSRRSRELREERRGERLDEILARAVVSEETAGTGEPTQWVIDVHTNMHGFEASGAIVASNTHEDGHHEYVVMPGDVQDAE